MKNKHKIAFFGSSLVSAYWNGAATYYRGIIKALNANGFEITFYEPDAFERQTHRDIEDPPYAKSVVYSSKGIDELNDCLKKGADADIIIKTSGVGVFDEYLEKKVLELKKSTNKVIFWDVDAPAALDRIEADSEDYFRPLIKEYDLILTYGGGPPVVESYLNLGARDCIPIYNALDPDTHYPVEGKTEFKSDLAFLGNRTPDREKRVFDFFFTAAWLLPKKKFLLGGSGWQENSPDIKNVRYLGHVYTSDHNAFNCTPLAILNISRGSMAKYGYSPATRIFEAAGAGACIITDNWKGLELFLKPGEECFAVENGRQITEILSNLDNQEASKIGKRAMQRVLYEHTYTKRAQHLTHIFNNSKVLVKEPI